MEKRKWENGEGPELYEKYELDALHSQQSEAIAIFYNVVPKILIAEDKDRVWELYDQAREKLLAMYEVVGGKSREDFHRMDMLLLRRAWEKIRSFEVGEEREDWGAALNALEWSEISSLEDRNMINLVIPFYVRLVRQMEGASKEDLVKIFDGGRLAMMRICENSAKAKNDFPKWEHLLTLRYSALVKEKT